MASGAPPAATRWPATRPGPGSAPLTATCHCGRVAVTVPTAPVRLNECRCSICYRYGALWAYYLRREVAITTADGAGPPRGYVRSDAVAEGDLGFFGCAVCGCVTHWEGVADTPKRRGPEARMGLNCRMLPEGAVEGVERVVTCVASPDALASAKA